MHGIFDIVIGVSRFRICHFNIFYCRYCLVYDNLLYIYLTIDILVQR